MGGGYGRGIWEGDMYARQRCQAGVASTGASPPPLHKQKNPAEGGDLSPDGGASLLLGRCAEDQFIEAWDIDWHTAFATRRCFFGEIGKHDAFFLHECDSATKREWFHTTRVCKLV